MRVTVVGATGKVGTSTLRALADAPEVESIAALARGADYPTPPLARGTSGALRSKELRAGVGGRQL